MQAVLITRGSRGMALFVPGTKTVHIPIHGSDEIADVTGAGDTVMATMTLALAAGATFEAAARLANYAGGIVVMKRGTATVSKKELRAAVHAMRPRSALTPWVPWCLRSDLLALVADARRAGRTVAFANGCFDLLHVGHVRYLAAAAQEADQLIVAINDDASVRALKGRGPAHSDRRQPRRTGRRAPLRRLRGRLSGTDGWSAARGPSSGRPLQGDRLHARLGPRA